jgi:acyl-CoA thioester hydrolase
MNEVKLIKPVPPTMTGFPVVIELPIQWGDLDVYGHVNNVVYLEWFEAARAAYAMQVGVEILSRDRGIGAILASVTCNYRRPQAFPGVVYAGARVSRISVGSVTLQYLVTDAATGVPVADGESDAVLYDYAANEPVAVPGRIRAAVEELEGKSFPSRS